MSPRRGFVLVLLLCLPAGAFAEEAAGHRASELARLRREVETLSSEIAASKEDTRARIKAVEAQVMEVEVQLRREELRLSQVRGEVDASRAELARSSTRGETLTPALLESIRRIRTAVDFSLPFHLAERQAELDRIQDQLASGLISPEGATARLWAFTEDELRLTRENGLDRQIVPLDGQEVLADVARLGMVALYFRTDGGLYGTAVRSAEGWTWKALTLREDQRAVESFFNKVAHGVRSGDFTLPDPGAGS
ncbi:MAG: DUF3450 family protein [Deltaproteobacteria bacterium]|nr:DUF3450 family protein [Deltaproteobacteria bacterium]